MTDFFSGLLVAFALIGLGFIIGAVWAWRGTRPEPPPPPDFSVPDYPPDEFDWTGLCAMPLAHVEVVCERPKGHAGQHSAEPPMWKVGR